MANVQRVLQDYFPHRSYPVKASVNDIQVGHLTLWNSIFQGNTSQDTIQTASQGSAGSSTADARVQFATLFAGVAKQRHDQNSYDKVNFAVSVDCEAEFIIANSSGVDTAATADFDPGTKVGVAVDANSKPISDRVVVEGHGSVTTIASTEVIGKLSRQIKNGDKTARIHLRGIHVYD